jgi:hypothetical protein
MEGLIFDIDSELGQPHYFTFYSDLHDDARECAHKLLKVHMDKRAALPNAHFFGIGDISNFIMPGPDKRHTPSTPVSELADEDEYIDKQIDRQCELYRAFPWVGIGIGNHCTSVINHHHTNPVKRLIDTMNRHEDRRGMIPIQYAGYSGFARFRFNDGTGSGARCSFNVLYHHGAWGGQVIKGLGGAKRWAACHDGWDVAVYGHNHQLHAHQETRLTMNQNGKITHRDIYIVNTGTFLRGQTQGGSPAYSEIKGYPPISLSAPLLKVVPTRDGVAVSVEIGDC